MRENAGAMERESILAFDMLQESEAEELERLCECKVSDDAYVSFHPPSVTLVISEPWPLIGRVRARVAAERVIALRDRLFTRVDL